MEDCYSPSLDGCVSILMPTKNSAPYLAAAVASVVRQTWQDWELLVLDNGSTDETREIGRRWARVDRRVKVLDVGDIGLVGALNEGVAQSVGALIARLDSDDIAHPSRLTHQVATLQHARVDLAASWLRLFRDSGTMGAFPQPLTGSNLRSRMRYENLIAHGSVLARKSAVVAAGSYRSEFFLAEDFDLWLRMMASSDFVITRQTLTAYRVGEHGTSVRHSERQAAVAAAAAGAAGSGQVASEWCAVAAQISSPKQLLCGDMVSADLPGRSVALQAAALSVAKRGEPPSVVDRYLASAGECGDLDPYVLARIAVQFWKRGQWSPAARFQPFVEREAAAVALGAVVGGIVRAGFKIWPAGWIAACAESSVGSRP